MIIDSNILIDFLKGNSKAIEFVSQLNPILTSVVVISELYAGILNNQEMQELDEFIEHSVEQIAVSEEIAREAGILRMRYGKSHGIRLPDALIAATANQLKIPVASLDKKHFSPLSNRLVVPY